MTDLETLKLHGKPNQFLMLPENFGAETPHARSPVLQLAPKRVFDIVHRTLAAEPRVTVAATDAAALRLELVQRTPVLRFADDVTIEIVPADGGAAALAIYSRSRLGYSDLGVNAKRVRLWVDKIRAAAGRETEADVAST